MPKLFVYGTLKDPQTQKKVIGKKLKGKATRLSGFDLTKVEIDGESFPALVPGSNSIDGLTLELTEVELRKIDRYETSSYKRIAHKTDASELIYVYIKA